MKGHTFFFSSSPPFTEKKTTLLQSWMSVRDLSIESNWPCKWYASSCAEQRTTADNFLIVSRKGISNTHRVPFHWIKFKKNLFDLPAILWSGVSLHNRRHLRTSHSLRVGRKVFWWRRHCSATSSPLCCVRYNKRRHRDRAPTVSFHSEGLWFVPQSVRQFSIGPKSLVNWGTAIKKEMNN